MLTLRLNTWNNGECYDVMTEGFRVGLISVGGGNVRAIYFLGQEVVYEKEIGHETQITFKDREERVKYLNRACIAIENAIEFSNKKCPSEPIYRLV